MSVNRVASGTNTRFSPEEEEALRKDDSTSKSLNDARRKAGQKGDDVAVRGDDNTLAHELEHKKTHLSVGKAALAAIDGLHLFGAVGTLPHVFHSPAAIVAAGVATLAGIHVAMWEMQDQKDGLRDAATRDVLHAGMLMSLELPKGFVDQETSKLGVGTTGQAPAKKVSDQIIGTPLGATMQRHCDEGIRAAQKYGDPSHPAIAERYKSDAAFRAGFDGLMWAEKHNPADAKQLKDDVEMREQHYAAAHVQLRV